MFRKVLIANRGAIACRIIRTLKALGVQSVAVYSEADAQARHVREADEAVPAGPGPGGRKLPQGRPHPADRPRLCGAQAIHPGYGFLSENPAFAQACEDAGIAFIGPTAAQMRAFGLKHTARELALQQGVPLLPGSDLLADVAQAQGRGAAHRLPGHAQEHGGRWWHRHAAGAQRSRAGRRLCLGAAAGAGQLQGRRPVPGEAGRAGARHIEVQVFGDGQGGVLALGERDCSVQRRNQKVIEETRPPA